VARRSSSSRSASFAEWIDPFVDIVRIRSGRGRKRGSKGPCLREFSIGVLIVCSTFLFCGLLTAL
jgi:hypothetical protein